MATILTSKIAPVAAKLRFKGILEAAFAIRFLLRQLSNSEIREQMTRLFGEQWNRPNQERRYYDLLQEYVHHHHQADYVRFLLKENIRFKRSDKKTPRSALIRYVITEHGLHGESEIVNDLEV